MTDTFARQIDLGLRKALPFLTMVVAMLVDLLPLPGTSPDTAAPFVTLGVFYFWSIQRPDLLPPLAVFLLGLGFDLTAGLPIGMSPLVLLATRGLMLVRERSVLAKSFGMAWFGFLLTAFVAAALRWLVASSWWAHAFAFQPLFAEAVLTVLLYPLLAWLLGRLQTQLPRGGHAARG